MFSVAEGQSWIRLTTYAVYQPLHYLLCHHFGACIELQQCCQHHSLLPSHLRRV